MDSRVLADDELLHFAEGKSGEAEMSVIVEVKSPPVRLAPPPVGQRGRSGIDTATGGATDPATARRLEAVVAAVSSTHGGTPTVLPGACAVVATVTPEQLRRLAGMSEVELIRRNRRLRGATA